MLYYFYIFYKEGLIMAVTVTKDTKIGDLLMINRRIAVLLMQAGMHLSLIHI